MNEPVFVCQVTDVPKGSMRTYRVSGKSVALINVDGDFFAVDDMCTHEQCSLGTEGALDGNVVVCGCHGAMFDVTNGKVMAPPAPRDLRSYAVTVDDGKILITVD